MDLKTKSKLCYTNIISIIEIIKIFNKIKKCFKKQI